MGPENKFRKQVEKTLDESGAWYVKFVAGPLTRAGIPDILGCLQGRFFGLELKGGSSYGATALQKYHIERINNAGGVGIILYPGGMGKFKKILANIKDVDLRNAAEDEYTLR